MFSRHKDNNISKLNTKEKQPFIQKLLYIVFFVILLFYIYNCIMFTATHTSYRVLFSGMFMLVGYIILIKGAQKLQSFGEIYLRIGLILFSVILYTIWGIYANSEPVSDYEVLIEGAKKILDGTFPELSFDKTNYFYFFNYQTGYSLYLAGIMKLFGQSLIVLKISEIIVLALTNYIIYLIGCKLYNSLTGIIASILYTTLLFNIAGSSIINNQHISSLFIVLAIYLFIDEHKIWKKLCVGICLALSYILRPNAVVIFICIFAFIIYDLIRKGFKPWKKYLISSVCIILSFIIPLTAIDKLVVYSGLAPSSLTVNNVPYYKFIYGFQPFGIYNIPTETAQKTSVYFDLEQVNFDYDKYNQMCKDYIIDQYTHNTKHTISEVIHKLERFTGAPDNQIIYAGSKVHNDNNNAIAERFINSVGYEQYLLLIIASFITVIIFLFSKLRNKKIILDNDYMSLFMIIFLLYFFVHVFIETQTRYRYEQYIVLTLLCAPLLTKTYQFIMDKLNKIK